MVLLLIAASGSTLSPTIPILIGVIGATITGVVAYLAAKRQTSGSAATASAATIFEAAEAIRKEQREEIISLRTEVVALKNEMIAMRAEAVAMREEMILLRREGAANHQEMITRTMPEEK